MADNYFLQRGLSWYMLNYSTGIDNVALMLPQTPFKGISLSKSVYFKHNLVTSNVYFWVPKNKSDALFSSSFSVLNCREQLPAWYRQIQELPTFKDSAALGRGRKLRKRGRGKKGFFPPLSIKQGPLQCTAVWEESCVLWYHLAITDGLCYPDLTGRWATLRCRWSAPRLPCTKKRMKNKIVYGYCRHIYPLFRDSHGNEKLWPLEEVGKLLCWRKSRLPRDWRLSACYRPL